MSKITFILGGVRSGKSSYALKLSAKAKRPAFIATCQALDDEMRKRIAAHKSERPRGWTTFEEPLNVASVLRKIRASHDLILIDCLTLLVSNLMLRDKDAEEIEAEIASIIRELNRRRGRSIIVSNEVGLGVVPPAKLGRQFRDIAGAVNKIAAAESDSVIFMVSGIPWRIK